MFKTILVPVDLDDLDSAKPALEKAEGLAEASGGTLRLVYVRSEMPAAYMEYVPREALEKESRGWDDEVKALADTLRLPAERRSFVVRRGGSVYHEVLDEAEDCKADLVVVGSHRPSMSTYLLGSNATTIVRHATVSVLVVR